MKIVSENTEADIARERAMQRVRNELQEITANLIRVVRGAGRPHEIARQSLALTEALTAYQAAAGMLPLGDDLAAVIQPEEPGLHDWRAEDQVRHYARQRVIDGALQVAASRLLGQLTQERAGEREMHDGMVQIEEMRAATRARAKEEARAYKAAQRAKPVRRKRPTKPKGAS